MIISFGGSEGSGKSGMAKRLAKELGWPYYDMGSLRRSRATELGLTLEEYNKLGEIDPRTDTEVDEYQKKLGQEQDNFVIVGRTSWHFIPHSLKIFLKVSLEVGSQRVYNDLVNRKQEASNLKTLEDVRASLKRRLASDIYRYQTYFKIDVYDPQHFDVIIETDNLSEEEVYQKILQFVQEKL